MCIFVFSNNTENKMSVLIQFAMFPTDKGESVSPYVGKIWDVIKNSGFNYQPNAMSTAIETNTVEEALKIVNDCYKVLEPDCNRVYTTFTMDVRQDHQNCMENKVKSALREMKK